jgi:hypothetical protein
MFTCAVRYGCPTAWPLGQWVNINASSLVAMMFPSIHISSFGRIRIIFVYCVLYCLHNKALEDNTFIYYFIYFLFCLVSYGTVCIRRKLRKEHRAPLTRDLGGQ